YYMKDGLPNEYVFGILEDEEGNLWISTNNGISKFNPETKQFKNFGVSDGLQSREFRQAFCKSRSGRMYFGGVNGFNVFHPKEIFEVQYDPPIVLTDFQIFNKAVPIVVTADSDSPLRTNITDTKSITLQYDQSVFSFEFASLNYTTDDKKQYAYMLKGFDKDWNYVDKR